MMDARGADRRIRALAQTLALLDESTWYLVSLDDPQQVAIFTAAFPAFKGIEIPPMMGWTPPDGIDVPRWWC